MKKLTAAALGLIALVALPASAANWSDTSIGYRQGPSFQEPGIEKSIAKQIFSLTHVSGYAYGSNFFNVDMLQSDKNDPMNSATNEKNPSRGAQEVYVAYRHNLSFSALTKSKVEFGPVRDVEFTFGFDYNAKNTTFAPSVWKLMAGPTLSFKVPGFLTVGLLYYSEKNHNAFGGFDKTIGGGEFVNFDPTYQVALAFGIDVPLGKVNSKVKGFGTLTGAKGKDGSAVETKPETLLDAFWMFDASPVFGAKKGTFQVGPGYEYWNNKFGDPTFATYAAAASTPRAVANPRTSTVMFAVEYHF